MRCATSGEGSANAEAGDARRTGHAIRKAGGNTQTIGRGTPEVGRRRGVVRLALPTGALLLERKAALQGSLPAGGRDPTASGPYAGIVRDWKPNHLRSQAIRLHRPVLALLLFVAACHVDATTPEATTPTGPNGLQPPDSATNLNYPEPGDYITVGRGGSRLSPCQPEGLAEGSCRASESDTIRVHPGDTIRVSVGGSGVGPLEVCTVVVSGPQDVCAYEIATGERAIFQASWLDHDTVRCRYEAEYAQLVRAAGGTYELRGGGGGSDCLRLQVLGVLPIDTTSTPWGVGGNGFPMTFVQHKTYVARECADSYLYGEVSEGVLQRLSGLVPRPDTVWVFITGCPGDTTGPNRAPVVAMPMPDRMWAAGPEHGHVVFDAAAHFRDPDGNRLAYTVASSDTAVVSASFAGRANGGVLVDLEMRAVGAASVTVNVRDPGGLDAQAVFAVMVTGLQGRAVLTSLYEATGGPNWTRRDNWLTDAPLWEWHGVFASLPGGGHSGYAFGLDLGGIGMEDSGNGLTGAIPPELGNLDSFRSLILSNNDLTGPIPPELGDLRSLRSLGLSNNDLTGSIPWELAGLDTLWHLSLHSNGLTGSIPPELGGLDSLRTMRFSHNDLSGPIPAELGNLGSLEYLSLERNALAGRIPPEVGNLANLTFLYLSYNDLTGPIPAELGNLGSLEDLYLNRNTLTGPIPPELGDLTSVDRLWLDRNALTGAIPPELGNLTNLTSLYLSHNNLSGPIPPELGDLGHKDYLNLDLSDNALTGPIPPELGDLLNVDQSQAVTGGRPRLRLDLSNNDLSGSVPAEIGQLVWLEQLYLSGNEGLEGPLPESLTQLQHLTRLLTDGTRLCAPTDDAFQAWLSGIQERQVANCAAIKSRP